MLIVHLLAQAAAAAAPEAAAAPQQGVISYPAAYFTSYQPANAMEMVNRLPGFSLDSGSSVRGFEGSAGNVLIDGQRPASKTDSLDEMLRRMPASQVERIDLIRGGAPGIDMQGKTVLANIVRRKGAATRLLVAAAPNHAWDGRTVLASRFEGSGSVGERKWEFGSFFGKGVDDGMADGRGVTIHPDGSPTEVRQIKAEGDILQGFASGTLESPLAGGRLRLNGRYASEKFKGNVDDLIVAPAAGVETLDDTVWTDSAEIGGNYSRPFGARTTLDVVGLHQIRDRRISSLFRSEAEAVDFDLGRESSETIGRAILKYKQNDRLSFEGGGEVALNKLDSQTRLRVNGQVIELPAANVQVEELRSEIIAKAAWRPTDRLTFDGGLRYETSTISSEGVVVEKTLRFLKPRLAAAWAVSEGRQVRLRVEREVGQLNFDDFVATGNLNTGTGITAGNPDLNPEQAWVAEAAFEQRFWGSGVIVLTVRHYQITDVVDRGPIFTAAGDVFDAPQNIGDGTKDEISLELTLPLDRLGLKGGQIRGDVTKRWSQVEDPTTGEDREISGLHPVDFNVSFVQDIPSRRLSWGVDLYGAWRETYYRFDIIETVKLRSFVRPFVEWRPSPDLNIRFEIPNATARDFRRTVHIYPGPRSAGGQPVIQDRLSEPGRMFYFRVRKTFG
jgi:hypothetical protein